MKTTKYYQLVAALRSLAGVGEMSTLEASQYVANVIRQCYPSDLDNCKRCDGTKIDPSYYSTCVRCHGVGEEPDREVNAIGQL